MRCYPDYVCSITLTVDDSLSGPEPVYYTSVYSIKIYQAAFGQGDQPSRFFRESPGLKRSVSVS